MNEKLPDLVSFLSGKLNFFRSKILFWEVLLFSITLFLGIFSANRINKYLITQGVKLPPINVWQFLIYFAIVTAAVVAVPFLIKAPKGKGVLFKAVFLLAIFFGGILTLSIWIGDLPSIVVMGILVFWWFKRPSVFIHNLCVILGISGIGGTLGLRLTPEIMVVLLLAFSVYDFLAVYKTKHMVKMAKQMVKHQAILGLIIPPGVSRFKGKLKKVKPGGKYLILGGGDIAFPLVLCASFIPQGIYKALALALFALGGLVFSFFVFSIQKKRKPIPALPPITAFCVLGYLIVQFVLF